MITTYDDPTVDREIAMIVDYLQGELPREDMEEVEERLVKDTAFFELAVPLMQVHNELLQWGADVRAARAAETAEQAPALSQAQTILPITTRKPKRYRFGWQTMVAAAMAATTLFVAYLTHDPELIQTVGVHGQQDAFTGVIETTTEPRDFATPDGSRVRLDAHGSATYDARMTRHRLILSLTGSATINVPAGQDTVMIARNGGFVKLAANGSYVVKAPAGDSMIRVAVLKGGAVMTGSVHATSLTLVAGQMGAMSATPQFVGMVPDSMRRRVGGGG